MQHLDEGTLHAVVDGEIPSTELGAIRAHLDGCAACRAGLEEARSLAGDALGLVEALDDVQTGKPVRRWTGGVRLRNLAWAAGIVLAAGLGYAGGRWRTTPPGSPVVDAGGAAPAEVAVADPEPPVATPRIREPDAAPVTRRDPPPPVAEIPRPAPPAQAQAETAVVAPRPVAPRAEAMRAQARDLSAPSPAIALGRRLEAVEAFEEVSFPEAIGKLGGRLRLIEGLAPERVLAARNVVRVLYAAADGDIVLEQVLQGDSVSVRLTGPPSVGVDSLAALRRRIR